MIGRVPATRQAPLPKKSVHSRHPANPAELRRFRPKANSNFHFNESRPFVPHDELNWRRDWQMRLAAWIESRGTKAVGADELELLRAIDRWRSISEAARQLGRSYRWAWLAVQAMNEAAGTPLVQSAAGGRRGGGASLTDSGREAASMLAGVQSELETAAAESMRRR
jgi:molybdate transport system regulatory protein